MVDDRGRGCRSFSNYKGSIGGDSDTVAIRKLFVILPFMGCFIARYAEVDAFKTALLLHEALLIITGGNGPILIETRCHARRSQQGGGICRLEKIYE